MRGPEDGTLSEALLILGKDLPGTACAVLGVTIASHMTMHACHPVTFWSLCRFLQSLMTFLDVYQNVKVL